jgi:hypothetical protein
MGKFIGQGGAHREIAEHHVGVGGVWRRVAAHYIGVGGVWRLVSDVVDVVLTNASAERFDFEEPGGADASASAAVILRDTGVLTLQGVGTIDVPGEWLVGAGDPTDFEMRWTLVSGDSPSGVVPALGTWRRFGAGGATAASFTNSAVRTQGAGIGSTERSSVVRAEIRKFGGSGTILASAEFTVTATADIGL